MNNRQRVNAIMHYEPYDRMPAVAFGYWKETLEKWCAEGHVTRDEVEGYDDNNEFDRAVMGRLGFDFNWNGGINVSSFLRPGFKSEVIATEPDGSVLRRDGNGLLVRIKPGVVSIPANAGTSMTGREAWEELYLPKLTYSPERVDFDYMKKTYEEKLASDLPVYLFVGSLYGKIRDMLGVEGLAYLAADDEDLYVEIIDTVGKLCYQTAEQALTSGIPFDYAHYWEDICFKNGPLVRPSVFQEYVAPWYRKISDLLNAHGVDIISVDCDGCIDKLVPIWLESGVNTMFPIEIGTWHASFDKWRAQYGKTLRGVGGMDKRVFAQDFDAVDREIERLKPIVELGGYIPCPDHRIAPDAKWDNVRYYCDRFHEVFG